MCLTGGHHTPLQISDMAPPNAPAVPSGTAPGVFVRGTLRMPREGLFDIVNANLKQNFGGCHRDQDVLKPCSLSSLACVGVFIAASVLVSRAP